MSLARLEALKRLMDSDLHSLTELLSRPKADAGSEPWFRPSTLSPSFAS